MLTFPATRIDLTASDIAGFERRFALKRSARLQHHGSAALRLRPSAGHLTKLGFVPAHANTGRKRAESSSSQATICTEDGNHINNDDAIPQTRHEELPAGPTLQETTHNRVARATNPGGRPQNTITSRQWPLERLNATDHDGANEGRATVDVEVTFRTSPRLRQPSDTTDIDVTFLTSRSHQTRTEEQTSFILPDPALNPGAPVFVPRMRFGSTTSHSTENGNSNARSMTRTSTTDMVYGTFNLRTRSSSERNTLNATPRHERQDSAIGVAVTTGRPTHHPRSRTNDQNTAATRPIIGLDRYPPVRPAENAAGIRGAATRVVFPRRRSSRQHLVDFEQRSRRQPGVTPQPATNVRTLQSHLTVPIPVDGRRRPISPGNSTASRSTPNLLDAPSPPVVHARSSSVSWKDDNEDLPPIAHRSHAQSGSDSTASGSGELTGALERWLNRDSPLDELAQQLDMLTTRPRSVGRSFERPCDRRARLPLLVGELFQLEESPERQCDLPRQEPTSSALQTSQAQKRDSSTSDLIDDPVALALALPSPDVPLSPAVGGSPFLPSTPPVAIPPTALEASFAGNPSSSKLQASSASATPSSVAATATPGRIPVYNDNKPPGTQPRTPADLIRRNRGRSEATTAATASRHPTAIPTPSRNAAQRHTYPNIVTPSQHQPGSPAVHSVVGGTPGTATRRPQRSANSENEIEANLEGLAEDRRTWMRRREDGSLDVTPPREGRFERFLS